MSMLRAVEDLETDSYAVIGSLQGIGRRHTVGSLSLSVQL
jgi:hypothetical protein